jgi:Ricin-type beta-trefoil lectin domain
MRNVTESIATMMTATLLTMGDVAAQGASPAQMLRMVIQSHPAVGEKCLDIAGAQFIDGMRLQTFDCNNQNDETFAYDQAVQHLVIGHLCVEAWGRGDAGDAVGLGVCNNDAANQRWRMVASGDYYQVVGINSRCLDVRLEAKDSGAALDIANCQPGNAGQLWALIEPSKQPAQCRYIATRQFVDTCGGCSNPPYELDMLRTKNDEWVSQFVDGNGNVGTNNWRSVSVNDNELIFQREEFYKRVDLFGRKAYLRKGNSGNWTPASTIIRTDC